VISDATIRQESLLRGDLQWAIDDFGMPPCAAVSGEEH
jgi:hypothetical protein